MPKTDLPKIEDGAEFAMRAQTDKEIARNSDAEIPEYKIKIDMTDAMITELRKSAFDDFNSLVAERATLGLQDKWDSLDRQYNGEFKGIDGVEFNLDVRESKIKADALVRSAVEAFLPDGGDIIDIQPRADSASKNGYEVAGKQQAFLDYAMDEEIRPQTALRKAFLSAAKKFVGVTKLVWSLEMQNRRREEHWEGKMVQVGTFPNGKPAVENEGLRNFLSMYPEAEKMYPAHVKKLIAGKSIDIVVNFREQVKNNPELVYIPLEDFFVRNACRGNEGMASEHTIVERRRYTHWELKKLEASGDFENVSDVVTAEDGKIDTTKEHSVLEFTTYFKLDESDEEETKIKAWFSEEKKVFLGAIQYPYYGIDCDYIGWWMTTNDYGFYGDARSVIDDLRDTHIAQDALISLTVDGIYKRNMITPIVESGSEAESLFLDHQFKTGKPIPIDNRMGGNISQMLGFVSFPNMDTNGSLVMLEKMKRIGSDVSRVSDLITGGESNLDPSAPATKTIAMLEQSGIGIRDYIRMLKPSFDEFASQLLQLYYQMSTEDRAYRIRKKSKGVTGSDAFANIAREDMSVRTVVQSRVATFAFDKVNETQKAMAAYQIVNSNPYLAQQPEVKFMALKTLLESFGGKWKTLSDSILNESDFKDKQEAIAVKVIGALIQKQMQDEQTTGLPQDPRQNMIQAMQVAPQAITAGQAASFDPAIGQQMIDERQQEASNVGA